MPSYATASQFQTRNSPRVRTGARAPLLDKLAGQNGRIETARGMPRIARIVSGTLSARTVRTPRPRPVFRNRKTVFARVAQVRLDPAGSEVRHLNRWERNRNHSLGELIITRASGRGMIDELPRGDG